MRAARLSDLRAPIANGRTLLMNAGALGRTESKNKTNAESAQHY